MTRVLLLDPDATRRTRLRCALNDAGVFVSDASDIDGLAGPDLVDIDGVIANTALPSGEGIALRSQFGDLPLILFADNGNVRRAVEAMQLGASDYFATPFEPDELVSALNRCIQRRATLDQAADQSNRMIGRCAAMLDLSRRIEALAETRTSLLIEGEPGSGTELVARALHAASPRRTNQMISCNCATIPESLIESELFGDRDETASARRGLIEAADRGTLFLDEIGALTLSAQTRLLRVLQGLDTREPTDVRLITATHRDLGTLVTSGRFLEALYVRLSAATLTVPPLRERGDDVIELANWLLQRICRKLSRPALRLSKRHLLQSLATNGPAMCGNSKMHSSAL